MFLCFNTANENDVVDLQPGVSEPETRNRSLRKKNLAANSMHLAGFGRAGRPVAGWPKPLHKRLGSYRTW
jgi:hypothetical protein